MRNRLLLLVFIAIVSISCEKLEEPEILGTFVHTPDGCVADSYSLYNCNRFITLAAGGVADVLYGGDIVSRTHYEIRGQKVEVRENDQFGLRLSFRLLDDGSLREESDQSIWIKRD